MSTRHLRAKRAKIIDDAKALIGKDKTTLQENARFDDMMVEADNLNGQIERMERAEAAEHAQLEQFRNSGRLRGMSTDEVAEDASNYDSAFQSWCRNGVDSLNEDQRRIYSRNFGESMRATAGATGGWMLKPRAALGTVADPAGGYTVPQGFYSKLIDAQLAYGGMINVANVINTTSGNPLPIPTDNDSGNKGVILGENAQANQQDITFGVVNLGSFTYSSKLILVSNQLFQDTAFDLDAYLASKLGTRIGRITNDHFTWGDGAAKPSGVIGSSSNAAPLGYTAGGSASSGSTATISYDDILELEHSVDPAYRGPNSRFMFHDSVLKGLKKLKDSQGRPLWLPGLAAKEPDTINGYPYVINQSMPAMGPSAKCAAFGDFSNYFIRRVAGVQVLRLVERYADFNQVGFLAFQRWDGQLVDAGTHPIKYLQNSAT